MNDEQAAHRPEQGNVPMSRVLPLLGLLAAVLLLVLAAAQGLSSLWDIKSPDTAAQHVGHFPSPELEPAPQPELAAYLKEKRQIAESYGWVDRQNGMVRIPIDAAMKALAEGHATPTGKGVP